MIATFFTFIYALLVTYLIPLVLAIGLIMFMYGCVNYFFIGPGDEGKREEGRKNLLWAFLLFLLGLSIYAVVQGFVWLGTAFPGAEVGESVRLQQVPNVPDSNN